MLLRSRFRLLGVVLLPCATAVCAPRPSTPAPVATAGTEQAGRGRASRGPAAAYPERPAVPAERLAHGQQIYQSNCSFCHGSDARGGESGPNLLRTQVVLDDQHGELIAPVVQNGIPAAGMPKFTLTTAEIAMIADWLHSQRMSDRGSPSTLDILVGNVSAGQAYFNGAGQCSQCHSVAGDLAGIGSRDDPKTIQNLIVSGGQTGGFGRRSAGSRRTAAPTTVKVTLPSGQVVTGVLDHITAFVVALREADGTYRSFARNGSTPQVVVTNPVQWHLDMLPKWRDSDIHDLTAYLASLKS